MIQDFTSKYRISLAKRLLIILPAVLLKRLIANLCEVIFVLPPKGRLTLGFMNVELEKEGRTKDMWFRFQLLTLGSTNSYTTY